MSFRHPGQGDETQAAAFRAFLAGKEKAAHALEIADLAGAVAGFADFLFGAHGFNIEAAKG